MSTQHNQQDTQSADQPAQTLEIVRFQLNNEVEAQAFIDASKAVNTFLKDQAGFLYRSLCQDGDQWLDVVYWANKTDADNAAKKLCQTPEVGAFMGMIEEASVTMEYASIHQSTCMEAEANTEDEAA